MYRTSLCIATLTVALLLTGCTDDLTGPAGEDDAALSTKSSVVTSERTAASSAQSENAAQKGPMIWAHGELFRSIVTSATFSGDQGNFDALYVLSAPYTFAGSYHHLSESAPGDQDYNGGRWEVFHLKSGVDAGKYDDVNSTDDPNFDPDDWMSTHVYFECPMLPQRG